MCPFYISGLTVCFHIKVAPLHDGIDILKEAAGDRDLPVAPGGQAVCYHAGRKGANSARVSGK